MLAADATVSDWLQLIRAEYLEFPGMHLTKPQVERLWGFDPVTCETLSLSSLTSDFFGGVLTPTSATMPARDRTNLDTATGGVRANGTSPLRRHESVWRNLGVPAAIRAGCSAGIEI